MMIGQHLAHVSQHPWGNWWCLVTRIDQPGVPAAVSRCCPQRVSLVGYEDWIPGWRIMGLSEQNAGTPLNPWVNHHYPRKTKSMWIIGGVIPVQTHQYGFNYCSLFLYSSMDPGNFVPRMCWIENNRLWTHVRKLKQCRKGRDIRNLL